MKFRKNCRVVNVSGILLLSTPLRSSMMQAGVCLRQDTETTLPELTEQHRIRQKEEELSGLESVHMAESETECAAPGLNTLEPECVTAHSGVSDVHHTHTSLIKTETDLGSTHSGDLIKMESLDSTELGYETHLHPDQIKTETDDGGYMKSESTYNLSNVKCVDMNFDLMKCESSEELVSDVMNTVTNGGGADHKDQTEGLQPVGEPNLNCKHEERDDFDSQCEDSNHYSDSSKNIQVRIVQLYRCSLCSESFPTMSHLKVHLTAHTGEKSYMCTQCGKYYCTKYRLNTHLKIHTDKEAYKCSYCGKCFSKLCNLKSHLMLHTGEKPYHCPQCGKGFSQICNLNGHIRTHTGEKPFKCAHCDKWFSMKSTLSNHQRIHSGEKPYKCSQCGTSFSRSSHLKRHQEIHTGEKPYKCSHCEMCFRTQNHLKTHLRTHTGERPYIKYIE
ncbi:hypothetical protein GJAV_G00140830 [Gymnothorax javanicus]|nr:hypothetical protein GJAV_G00140830 [Gymnothorax javanicus]